MIGTSKSESDVKIRQLKFVAFGFALLLVATIIGGAVIGSKTINRLGTIQSDWQEFRHVTAKKGKALSQIRDYFGFDGFIHDYQSFVSQRQPDIAGIVQRNIDELLAAVATYEIIGISTVESAALADIRDLIDVYNSNLTKAERLIGAGQDTDKLAPLMAVDNRPAFAAMAVLEVHQQENVDKETKQLVAGITEGERLIKMTIIFIPILALTVVVILWFMRRLVSATVETMEADEELREREEKNQLFAADVAHELRMPLAVMRLHLEKLKDRQTAKSLLQDVDKMSRMVEQLLAAAKMESGADQTDKQIDLHEICVEVGADMGPLAIKAGRTIEVLSPETPVLIQGNRFALEQAIRNLVENSIKYAARETKVVIEVTEEPAIKVTDKGPGIPAEMREAIFDRFLRTDRRSGGSGLGLSIVRRAAEVHNATIEIGDAPGGGSIFTIAFPRERARS